MTILYCLNYSIITLYRSYDSLRVFKLTKKNKENIMKSTANYKSREIYLQIVVPYL